MHVHRLFQFFSLSFKIFLIFILFLGLCLVALYVVNSLTVVPNFFLYCSMLRIFSVTVLICVSSFCGLCNIPSGYYGFINKIRETNK